MGYSGLLDECASTTGKCYFIVSFAGSGKLITDKIVFAYTTVIYFVLFFPKCAILLFLSTIVLRPSCGKDWCLDWAYGLLFNIFSGYS